MIEHDWQGYTLYKMKVRYYQLNKKVTKQDQNNLFPSVDLSVFLKTKGEQKKASENKQPVHNITTEPEIILRFKTCT